MKKKDTFIGVIGGSGLYQLEGFAVEEERSIYTPFGNPSDTIVIGRMDDKRLAFLARHGRKHLLMPTDINYRANIYAMKSLGVSKLISIAAVGSMREGIKPGSLGLPSQFIDQTRLRRSTFFGDGMVGHTTFAEPVCDHLCDLIARAGETLGISIHRNLNYVCIEGPQFNSRAESKLYQSWGADIVGMTNATEAKLAREAEMCYATLSMVTDYDSWHSGEEAVSVEQVLTRLQKSVELAKKILVEAVRNMPEAEEMCDCNNSMKNAIITPLDEVPKETLKKLYVILGRYY